MTSLTPTGRWLAIGRSHAPDARAAGTAAAQAALTHGAAQLLIVFCSHRYDLPALLGAIEACGDGAPLIGCSTAGEIATSGPGDAGVVVVALGGSGFSVRTAAASGTGRLRDAGAEVAGAVAELEPRDHQALLLLTDGLAGDQQEIVRGAHAVLGAGVPLVGGCAGDDLEMRRTFQMHGGELLEGSVVAAALGSDAPFGIGVRHGWQRVGEPMLVTRSEGTEVLELDGRPALDAYLDRLEAPAAVRDDESAFTRFALTHPIGMARGRGEHQVRFIGGGDFARRSLQCIAEVPEGATAWLMEGDETSVLDATDAACVDALEALGGAAPLGLLAFDCIARRAVLGGDGITTEVERISVHAGGAPVAGFYTYGEIARTRGVTGFHNQTLVVLAVG
jgi:hypothetical protein